MPALLGLAWGLAVWSAMLGWGGAMARLLRVNTPGVVPGLGIGVTCVFGGLLNWRHAVSPAVCIAWVLVGVILLLLTRPTASLPPDRIARRLTIAWVAVSALVVAGAAWSPYFNGHDDAHGYLAFPVQMLQTGAIGDDPFGERRLMSLGGQSFLHALMLSGAHVESLHLLDFAGASAVLAGVIAAAARSLGASSRGAAAVALVAALTGPAVVNISANLTAALCYAALLLLALATARDRLAPLPAALAAGVVAAGLCSLKSQNVPAAVLFATLPPLLAGRRGIAAVAVGPLLAAPLLLPWMLTLRRSSGTLLYPLLGHGTRVVTPGSTAYEPTLDRPLSEIAELVWRSVLEARFWPAVVATLVAMAVARSRRVRLLLAVWLVTSLGVMTALNIMVQGAELPRYVFAMQFPLALIAMAVALADAPAVRRPVALAGVGLAAGLLLAGGSAWSAGWHRLRLSVANVGRAVRSAPLVPDDARAGYAAIQAAIPPGETVLTRLSYPFTLDFARNRLLLFDCPGNPGPPPGVPYFRGPDALATYITGRGIRYVAWSYADQAQYPREMVLYRLTPESGESAWVRQQARHAMDVQGNFDQLMLRRRQVFNDGKTVVIDLATPAPPPSPRPPGE